MKAYKLEQDPSFEPVVLELETQEEVDMLFAIMNHNSFKNRIGLPTDNPLQKLYSPAYEKYHQAICDFARGR